MYDIYIYIYIIYHVCVCAIEFSEIHDIIPDILEELLSKEHRVLEYWTQRKKRLDQCHQYVLFERSAKQALEWITETGELYLATHTNVGKNRIENEQLLREHNEFKGAAKVRWIKQRVTLFFVFFCFSFSSVLFPLDIVLFIHCFSSVSV